MSGYATFPSNLKPSDQGYVFGGYAGKSDDSNNRYIETTQYPNKGGSNSTAQDDSEAKQAKAASIRFPTHQERKLRIQRFVEQLSRKSQSDDDQENQNKMSGKSAQMDERCSMRAVVQDTDNESVQQRQEQSIHNQNDQIQNETLFTQVREDSVEPRWGKKQLLEIAIEDQQLSQHSQQLDLVSSDTAGAKFSVEDQSFPEILKFDSASHVCEGLGQINVGDEKAAVNCELLTARIQSGEIHTDVDGVRIIDKERMEINQNHYSKDQISAATQLKILAKDQLESGNYDEPMKGIDDQSFIHWQELGPSSKSSPTVGDIFSMMGDSLVYHPSRGRLKLKQYNNIDMASYGKDKIGDFNNRLDDRPDNPSEEKYSAWEESMRSDEDTISDGEDTDSFHLMFKRPCLA